MDQFHAIAQSLCGHAVFDDQWVVGANISRSLLSAGFEFYIPGSAMNKRRLLVVDISGPSGSSAAQIYASAGSLKGIVPCLRTKVISTEKGPLLLADTIMPAGIAEGRMTAYAVAKLGLDISAAILSLQNAGIVHRNIKPRSIVSTGECWLLDGLETADLMRNTLRGQTLAGTRMYMPAESLNGRYDSTTDLYSLAVVMYSLLNNDRPPLMGRYDPMTNEAVEQAIEQRMKGAPVPPLIFVDAELNRILRKALSPNPSQRYSDAAQMNADLMAYLHSADRQSVISNARTADIADTVMADPDFARQWLLTGCIGAGMYGTVYRALSRMDGREYALKVVRVPADDGELKRLAASGMNRQEMSEHYSQALARASSEALIYMQLTGCSHILRMYDYGRVKTYNSSGVEFFWMQTELLSPIPASIPDERAVAMIGLDVCTALGEIHAKGMTHRDVKPENILWAGNDGYKLSDFGVARMLRETTEATVIGSRSYMAPEILSGLLAKKSKKNYSNSVDIFSLGMTMYTLLNDGREPFLPPEPQPVTDYDRALAEQRRLNGEPLPVPVHCGRQLGAIISRACAVDPAKRFRSADDMREALLNYLES